MMNMYVDLSLHGDIVLLPVDLEASKIDKSHWEDVLIKLHREKIDLADNVHVMNVDGYIGNRTYEEIGYATTKGKYITYLEPIKKGVK